MHLVKINSETGDSKLIIGASVKDLKSYLPDNEMFIITDSNVLRLYGNTFPAGKIMIIEPGETSKSLDVVGKLCETLLESGADRSSFILGFGGGVVCDIAGMVASLYMRGVRHGFVSTTLLSQVDASIGGKTGVNLGFYKNIIGTFKQPEFVFCDQNMLATLTDEEYLSGIGELVKHAVIRDRELFLSISGNLRRLLDRDPQYLAEIIHRSVKIKAEIVRRDPLEKGVRRLLNFGHTFGHPIEMAEKVPHGIAVMKGMIIASELSRWKGELPATEKKLLSDMISRLGVDETVILPADIKEKIAKDKKSETGHLNVVLLRSIGKAVIRKIPPGEIDAFLEGRVNNK
jgi:3-dehydroquinate synthase